MNKRLIAGLSALVMVAALAGSGSVNAATSGLPGTSWWSSFQVMNVGSTDGTLVIQAYTAVGTTSAQYSSGGFTIKAGGGLTYNPGFAPNYSAPTPGNRIGFCTLPTQCNAAADDPLPSGFTGAVVASADVPIVAIGTVNNTLNGSVGISGGRATGSYDAFGGDKASTQLLFPLAKNSFAGDSVSYYVQAAGVDANVTITYTMNSGAVVAKQSATIPANHTFLFDPANASPAIPAASLGSAVVVASSGLIAGVALEYPSAPSGPAGIIGASRAFVASDYSRTVLAPIFKNDFAGDWNGWSLQNTTGIQASVDVTFTVSKVQGVGATVGQQFIQRNITIPAFQQVTLSKFRGNIGGMPAGVLAAGVAVSTQPLVAVVNESLTSSTGAPLLSTYNAFNPANATQSVAAPLVKEFFPGGRLGSSTARAGTSVTVQNAGNSNVTVFLRYTAVSNNAQAAAGTSFTVTIGVNQGVGGGTNQMLAPGASYVFNMVSDPGRAALYAAAGSAMPPDNVNYAVTISASGPVIALMQEDNKPPAGTTSSDLYNYEGFNQ
jgi:hypothetical protein